jgi:hypothetical protein
LTLGDFRISHQIYLLRILSESLYFF